MLNTSHFLDACPDRLRSLRSKLVADYFDEEVFKSSSGESTPLSDLLTFEDDELAKLETDFEHLLKQRKALQGLARAHAFRKWWLAHRAAYLTRPVIRSYRDSGLTLGELLDEVHLHYMASQNRRQRSSWFARCARKVVRNRAMFGIVVAVGFLIQQLGGFLWSLLLLGPGVQMVNSYTQTVITPLAQTANQKGSQDLGVAAAAIQSWLTNREKLKQVKAELHATNARLERADFGRMSRGTAEARWSDFEQAYFRLFLSYSQMLPSHLRDGRGAFKDLTMLTPVYLAGAVAGFDTQYWTHRAALDAAKSARERSLHRDAMRAAEDRIAGALAAWKLYEFMYPEVSRDSAAEKARGDLRGSYRTFASSMRFDVYVKRFREQVSDVLKRIDADFVMQDHLVDRLKTPTQQGPDEAIP